jgi:hypothetical protein
VWERWAGAEFEEWLLVEGEVERRKLLPQRTLQVLGHVPELLQPGGKPRQDMAG